MYGVMISRDHIKWLNIDSKQTVGSYVYII